MLLPLLWLAARTQTPGPLISERAAAAAVPGGWIAAERRADDALEAGFPSTAATDYRSILAEAALPADARFRVELSLVSALLDAGDLGAAEKELQSYEGPRNAAYHLRTGLLAAQGRHLPQAKTALAAIRPDELVPVDRGWWHFLQAQVADAENDIDRRNKAYAEADKAAVSELQRVTFLLGQQQALLRVGPPSEAQLNTWRGNMERNAGTRPGYMAARAYATGLAALKRTGEAKSILQRQLANLPASERETADQFRLMLGLIAGAESSEGRRAFRDLVRDGLKPDTQRTALYLLARGARNPEERGQLRRDLSELIEAPVLHPIIEDLLLVRAHTELADHQYSLAEDDARLLLERYPGSPLMTAALGVRLSVAWDLKRYRSAADFSTRLRAALPPGREHAELGVLLAEAFFRSGAFDPHDYQNAADAYDAALREAPLAAPAGDLLFQRVLSDIRSDRLEAAAAFLDSMTGNPAFDAVSRWQAEWNLVKAMQVKGQTAAAQARVEKLIGGAGPGSTVPAQLRIRLLWLRARLSYDNGQPAAADKQVDVLIEALRGAPLEPALRSDVDSTARLLKAQALFALGRDAEAAALLERLRADYKGAKAAVYSYIVQAAWYSQKGETVQAQQLLIKLADTHPESEFAPLALYEAALCAERRGLDDHLREADRLLEDRLIRNYPHDELVFYARLKEGDLLRKLNDFSSARLIYENLVNNYGQHPDVLLAQLALADSLSAQGGNSVVNYESAAALYERLRDLPTAPVDLRAEAGYKWGYALAHRAQPAKAQTVFWSVADDFLLDATAAAKLGPKGRWWVARSLLELGQLLEDSGRLDEAQRAYHLIVDNHLSGSAQAQAKLARYHPAEGAKR
ncbi:MAG: tol-pal system YbgF family protein [Opitutales bacterium]